MSDSILTSIKKILMIDESYTVFDPDIILHINSAFATLNELGLGPDEGFMIDDATAVWADFFTDMRLNSVKSYVGLRVKVVFDPPSNPRVVQAIETQIKELEWRLNAVREHTDWVNPLPPSPWGGPVIVDGGDS